MLVLFRPSAAAESVAAVTKVLGQHGLLGHTRHHAGRVAVVVTPSVAAAPRPAVHWTALAAQLRGLPGVAEVEGERAETGIALVGRRRGQPKGVVEVDGVAVGGQALVMMAGPCAVESERQLMAAAQAARAGGAQFLRGGAFKPRTSPYDFQGLGKAGLLLLRDAGQRCGLRVVTEVVDAADVALVAEHAHLLQVGARNMQNFALLKALGQQRRPVLLKRGLSATYREWLLAAEYVVAHGNANVILCERGIRTFEPQTRNTLDVAAVPMVRAQSHLPILIDPSHATGRRDLVAAVARAGIAAGADGLLIEIHPNPEEAVSDGPQSLPLPDFVRLGEQIARLAPAVDRTFCVGAEHVVALGR